MITLESIIKSLELLKLQGVREEDALDCLEFDSDQYPDPKILEIAMKHVYNKIYFIR